MENNRAAEKGTHMEHVYSDIRRAPDVILAPHFG